jgi:peptidoglycan/LPS O-acetylase OafA/YrhL
MNNKVGRLDKSFSLYLDAVRFIAAVLVVLAHYLEYGIVQGPLVHFVPNMGREAVIIFFVLSGFVIAYASEHKQQSARDYIIARCARIYSVALPVLLLSFAGAGLALRVFQADIGAGYEIAKAYAYLPFHLLFLGQLWTFSESPPWLGPYWSLGYEVWYYVLFGVAFYLRGARRWTAGAIVFAIAGYKLWLLLPVWLSGVWLYHWQKRHTVPRRAARLGWLATLILLAAYNLTGTEAVLRSAGCAIWPFPGLPLGSSERFLADYVVCAIVLANFEFARCARFKGIELVATPVRMLSSYTFTLYLAHGLILGAWLTFATAAIVIFTWLLGLLTERRKSLFHAFFDALADWLVPVRGRPARPGIRLATEPVLEQ